MFDWIPTSEVLPREGEIVHLKSSNTVAVFNGQLVFSDNNKVMWLISNVLFPDNFISAWADRKEKKQYEAQYEA